MKMGFDDALKQIKAHSFPMRRSSWPAGMFLIICRGLSPHTRPYLELNHDETRYATPWTPTHDDLLGDDWDFYRV